MKNNQLIVEIVTPEKKRIFDRVVSCSAPGVWGSFQILKNHTEFMSQLTTGELKLEIDGKTLIFALSGGFAEVRENKVTLLLETFESPEEIDVERARKALERAQRRLKEHPPGTDIQRAQAALARAMNRLRVAKKVSISQN